MFTTSFVFSLLTLTILVNLAVLNDIEQLVNTLFVFLSVLEIYPYFFLPFIFSPFVYAITFTFFFHNSNHPANTVTLSSPLYSEHNVKLFFFFFFPISSLDPQSVGLAPVN